MAPDWAENKIIPSLHQPTLNQVRYHVIIRTPRLFQVFPSFQGIIIHIFINVLLNKIAESQASLSVFFRWISTIPTGRNPFQTAYLAKMSRPTCSPNYFRRRNVATSLRLIRLIWLLLTQKCLPVSRTPRNYTPRTWNATRTRYK